jgi:Ca2+-dependent lipid-binding protein
MDTFGASDPFVQIFRVNPIIPLKDGIYATPPSPSSPADYTKVYESEVIAHTLNPEWRSFVLTMKELCTGNVLCPLIVRVFDWNKTGSNDLIGEFAVDLYTLLCKGPSNDSKYALINPSKVGKSSYKHSGVLAAKVKLLSKYELTSQDPKLVEDLVTRAPFLLGWQPGLELKHLQNKGKLARAKTTVGSSLTNAKSPSSLDLKLKMQEQSMNNMSRMMTKAASPRKR